MTMKSCSNRHTPEIVSSLPLVMMAINWSVSSGGTIRSRAIQAELRMTVSRDYEAKMADTFQVLSTDRGSRDKYHQNRKPAGEEEKFSRRGDSILPPPRALS